MCDRCRNELLITDKGRNPEAKCPCCLGQGQVIGPEGKRMCPLCEGYLTVPEEVAQRFLEVAAKRLPGGRGG